MVSTLASPRRSLGPMVPAAAAQDPPAAAPTTACGHAAAAAGGAAARQFRSGRLADRAVLRGAGQRRTLVDPQTYLYYMQIQQKRSRPSEGVWVPYDDSVERLMREDFTRLCNTNFLDNISIETQDYTFSNGVIGKIVLYNMEERQRVKIVTYQRSKKFEDAEDRREAQGAERRDPPRYVHRRGALKKVERHHPRHDAGEGVPVRRGQPTRSRSCRADRSWST